MTKPEALTVWRNSGFGIRVSSFFRISSSVILSGFVIRHSFGFRHSSLGIRRIRDHPWLKCLNCWSWTHERPGRERRFRRNRAQADDELDAFGDRHIQLGDLA